MCNLRNGNEIENPCIGNNFIEWIKILLKNQEFWIINGSNATKYFRLKRGDRQWDPISAYLFILSLILFLFLLI